MSNTKFNNAKITTVIVFITTLGMCLLVLFIDMTPSWDFRNNLWAPSYLMIHGQSPYNIDLLFSNSNAVWMPMIIGIFFPLGLMPLQQASNLWLVINFLALLFLIWISSSLRLPSRHFLFIAAITVFLFPPVITHLHLGQFSIGITILFLVVTIWNVITGNRFIQTPTGSSCTTRSYIFLQ